MAEVTHAIGDEAVRRTIESYEKLLIMELRIICAIVLNHCQITDEALLERIGQDDILVMAQPIFIGL